jgi:hypothetical protein
LTQNKSFLLSLISLISFSSYCQISDRYPIVLDQVKNYSSFINPTEISTTNNKTGISLFNQNLRGPFNNIRTTVAQGYVTFKKDSSKIHTIGVNFYSDKEGSYISNSRGYVTYSYEILLRKSFYIVSGIALGITSVAYENSQSNNSSSASALDGNLSVSVVQNKFRFCVGINQFPQKSIVVIDEKFTFKRFYTFYGIKNFDINYALRLNLEGLLSIKSNQASDINLTSNLILKEHLNFGLGYWSNRGLVTLIGFENIRIHENTFKFIFSYSFAVRSKSSQLNQEQIGLSLGYNFK